MTRKGRILRKKANEAVALPKLERALTKAAAAQSEEQDATRLHRPVRAGVRRVAAIGVVCLAFGGTAMAATGLWNPEIGINADRGPASTSDTPVPNDLTEVLGVLRRPPTAQDRGPEVEKTLQEVNPGDGVRPDSVRYLAPGVDGQATVLISAERSRVNFAEGEGVCIAKPFDIQGLDPGARPSVIEPPNLCFVVDQILAGDAQFGIVGPDGAALFLGLVPDGVDSVIARFGSAPDREVPVANNYFELSLGGAELSNDNGEAGPQQIVWLDADGNVVPKDSAAEAAVAARLNAVVEDRLKERKAP